MNPDRFVVVMAGGRGERFWPLSRRARPKQLIRLPGGRTLLEDAVARVCPLVDPSRVLVVTGVDCAGEARKQLPDLPPENIVAEPVGRDTAAAIGLAATIIERRRPDSTFVAMPADHVVARPDAFRTALQRAFARAATGALVTLGITPRGPETTWGYLKRGTAVEAGVYAVDAFHEKPDRAKAESYVRDGQHYWNAGIFAWRSRRILDEIGTHLPVLGSALAGLESAIDTDRFDAALEKAYAALPKISIDYAVMEKASGVELVEADFGLSDVGTWEAFAAQFLEDPQGRGAVEASDCLVFSDAADHLIVVFGASNMIVAHTADATLVCPRERASDLKVVVKALQERGLEQYL